MIRALALIALAGCSTVLGIDNLEGPSLPDDGGPDPSDGPPVPGAVRISGVVQQLDGSLSNAPVPAALVSLVPQQPDVSADTVVTDENGKFELMVSTSGTAFRAVLDVNAPGFRPTRMFLPKDVIADVEVTVQVFEMGLLQMFGSLCGPGFVETRPVILAFVIDAQGSPLVGAPIASTPTAKWCGTDGFSTMPDRTGFGGFAFEFDLPPGPVEVRSGQFPGTFVDAPGATNVVLSVDGMIAP